MSRIRIQELGQGQHPTEVRIAVMTADGSQESLIVDRRSIDNGMIDVGFPVGSDEGRFLVELPRESMTGQWRVWVKRDDVLKEVPA